MIKGTQIMVGAGHFPNRKFTGRHPKFCNNKALNGHSAVGSIKLDIPLSSYNVFCMVEP